MAGPVESASHSGAPLLHLPLESPRDVLRHSKRLRNDALPMTKDDWVTAIGPLIAGWDFVYR
jgi:hypothetical protein